MKPQYDHQLINSFYLWVEDRLHRVGEAYVTGLTQNFVYSDVSSDVPSNMYAYYSNDRQFSTIGDQGASGVYINEVFYPQSYTGTKVVVDNYKGRVLIDSSFGTSATVSGNFPKKEINTYITEHDEESLLVNSEFISNGSSFLETVGKMGAERYTIPAVFITPSNSKNEPFAMGGLDNTIDNLSMVVISDDYYLFKGTMSLFKDTNYINFPLLGAFESPYGGYFDIKESPYTYTGYTSSQNATGQHICIDEVNTSVFKGQGKELENLKGKYIGFIDFTLSNVRSPRIC